MTKGSAGAGVTRGTVSGERVLQRLNELAQCTDEPGRITRLYLSPSHRKAADLVGLWMAEGGMTPRVDAIGNVIARYDAATRDAPVLLLGSHIDSVPNGGAYDGTLGVLTAIEVVTGLYETGQRLPFAIEVVAFGDEEGTRFPSTLGGSRMLAGSFDPKILNEADASGVSRHTALVGFGCDPSRIPADTPRLDKTIGYVEVHIEQGPVLEAKGLPVGVVTAINGATRGTIEVRGVGGHAGTIPMTLRQDAYCAAAEMAIAIERRALQEPDLVATVGRVEVPGGVVNSVPGIVRFTLDVRSPSDERRLAAVKDLTQELNAIAARRRVELAISLGYEAPAAPCAPRLSELLSEAVREEGVAPFDLPSGAGHDAMSFRGKIPIAMLFVRCRGGVSHSPAEFASADDIAVATRTLAAFVRRLAKS